MDDKEQMLANLRSVFEQWQALVAGLDEAKVSAPQFAGNMSIKDTMAHLWSWQQRSVNRFEAALEDRDPVYPGWPEEGDPEEDVDAINAWIYRTTHDLPWASMYDNWRTRFLRFMELVEAVPERDLLEVSRYSWAEGFALIEVVQGSYEHHEEHLEQIHDWLGEHGTTSRSE